VRDEELIGLWDSGPSDYGSMESSWLCLRGDGTGWSAWASAGGGASVSRLEWTCPDPGELMLSYKWTSSGTWQPGSPPDLATVDDDGADDTSIRTAYAISVTTSPHMEGAFTCLAVDEFIEFCPSFRRLTAAPTVDHPRIGARADR
jgi:hypothetical protein